MILYYVENRTDGVGLNIVLDCVAHCFSNLQFESLIAIYSCFYCFRLIIETIPFLISCTELLTINYLRL